MYTNAQDNQPLYKNCSKLLISESPLQVLPTLAVKIGLNEALMLQQVHYWISNPLNKNIKKGRVWVYKSYSEWKREFPFWSLRTIQRTILSLEEKRILIANTFNRLITDRTKWYTINYEVLDSLDIGTHSQLGTTIVPSWHDGSAKLAHSIPENTTEIKNNNNNENENENVIQISNKEPRSRVRLERRAEAESHSKPTENTGKEFQIESNDSVVVDLMNMVKGWAISNVLMQSWLKKHGEKYITQKIELTRFSKARNPAAYLNKAITFDWILPTPKEVEKEKNKLIETISPTHEENVSWYLSLEKEKKKRYFEDAVTKHPYFDKLIKSNGLDFISEEFIETTWFKMLMELIGRAKR